MKAVVIRSRLKEGLAAVAGVAAENANLPILRNVLLEATGGKLGLVATNLEIALTYVVPGKVLEEGRVSVGAGIFLGLVNSLSGERLNLEKKNNNLVVQTDNYHGTLVGMPADDFPLIPAVKGLPGSVEVRADVLKGALAQVMPAAETRDLRPELNTVFFQNNLQDLTLTTTDSFRLAEKTVSAAQFKNTFEKPFHLLIPSRTAQEVARVVRDNEAVVITRDESQILFATPSWRCVSRLTEGNFPDYSAIVPKEFEARLTLNKEELFNAVKVAGVLGGKGNEVTLIVSKTKKTIEVFSSDKSVGEHTTVLPAKVEGEVEKIVFNGRYFTDGLKAISDETVFVGVNGERPALVKGVKDGSYLYLLAPVLNS